MSDHDQMVYKAKLAEQAERYEEMVKFMKAVVTGSGGTLNMEERNLLSVAYKNAVGARRASWRVLDSITRKEQSGENTKTLNISQQYKATVEKEIENICNEVVDLLENTLLRGKSLKAEELVFYNKMKGDYFRYVSEVKDGSTYNDAVESAKSSYENAMEHAKTLKATNPIRLGLALNFSVFHYEIVQDPSNACKLAKEAFDTAVGELEDLTEDEYKDATLIMQLLRDNLTLWQSEKEPDEA